jgi:hypothetical protein
VGFSESMSSFKAIRAVSSTLTSLLEHEMDAPVPITLMPPDVTPSVATGKRINLYLFLVSENGYLKNQEIPGQGHPGTYGHPPLSLDLHYLMTAYGPPDNATDEPDLATQEILGDGMRVLHDFAIITRDSPYLDSELRKEFERVKIILQPASLEEFAKIWTALPGANFRCSVAYQINVVQIESERLRQLAAPVKTRRLHMSLVQRPQVDMVYRTPLLPGDPIGDSRVSILQSLTITGSGFNATKTWVQLGGLDPIGVVPQSDGNIQIQIPDNLYPPDFDHPGPRPIPPEQQLQPGPQFVRVLVQRPGEGIQGGLDRGTTFSEAVAQSSNQSVFTLVPSISSITPGTGTAAATTLTVNGTRLFQPGLTSFVYVDDVAIEVPWDATLPPPPSTQVQVALLALNKRVPPLPPSATPYVVRMQVNGAFSVDEKPFTLL